MPAPNRTALTIPIEESLHERICAIARRKGISVHQYCEEAIAQAVKGDAQFLMTIEERLTALSRVDAARKEIFGDHVLRRDAAADIREARAARADQIDRAARGDSTAASARHFPYPDRSSANLGAAQ